MLYGLHIFFGSQIHKAQLHKLLSIILHIQALWTTTIQCDALAIRTNIAYCYKMRKLPSLFHKRSTNINWQSKLQCKYNNLFFNREVFFQNWAFHCRYTSFVNHLGHFIHIHCCTTCPHQVLNQNSPGENTTGQIKMVPQLFYTKLTY